MTRLYCSACGAAQPANGTVQALCPVCRRVPRWYTDRRTPAVPRVAWTLTADDRRLLRANHITADG